MLFHRALLTEKFFFVRVANTFSRSYMVYLSVSKRTRVHWRGQYYLATFTPKFLGDKPKFYNI